MTIKTLKADRWLMLCLFMAVMARAGSAKAQAAPTAIAGMRLTAFGGLTGNFTGLGLAKNLAITAGADAEFRPFFTLYPAIEVRGTYPVDGMIDRQRNVLGGIRLARQSNRFHPYGDVLFGRGQINYGNGGYPEPNGNFYVVQSTSSVLSLGGGLEYALTGRFAAKGDFQFQRYLTPVTTTGTLYPKLFTAGVVYRFGFGGRVR